jgi:hypothetical protein
VFDRNFNTGASLRLIEALNDFPIGAPTRLINRCYLDVVDSVAVRAQAIHRDQQSRRRDAGQIHSKALKSTKFQ